MSNYFYGSSNVYRHFPRALGVGLFSGRGLQLDKCTRKTVLDAHLATLSSAGLVVASVLANFITEVCVDVTDEEVQLFARQQVNMKLKICLNSICLFTVICSVFNCSISN